MISSSPRNGSGHGRGIYAAPADVEVYRGHMEGYLSRRCGEWLDRHTDRATGEIREGIKDLCNLWRLDGHLVKAAIREGWLDPSSMPEGGIKNRQIGLLTAIVYCGGEAGRRFVEFESEAYLDRCEADQLLGLQQEEVACR